MTTRSVESDTGTAAEPPRRSIAERVQRHRVALVTAEAAIAGLVLAVVLIQGLFLFWAVAGVIALGTIPVLIAVATP